MTDRTKATDEEFDSRLTTVLREHYSMGAFPKSEIERRLWGTLAAHTRKSVRLEHPTLRSVLAAAAAVLVFIGGAEYGRHTAHQEASLRAIADDYLRTTAADLPFAIQTSGSRYVATLAELTEQAPHLSQRQRELGREVAVTTLYAAAAELLGIDREDDVLQETVRGLAAGTADFASMDDHPDGTGGPR